MEFVDLKKQYLLNKAAIDGRIAGVLAHGRFIMGPEIADLESRLADFVGIEHGIAVASGTDALMIAMMALGIGRGDEVITTPFTFIATAEMIALIGATPVFADIDARTYNIDPSLLEAKITPNTKAIMPVNLYGQCAAMDEINALALKHGLAVIEDAAQSFGATYKGRRSCGLSTIGCTSFFPSKPLGCYGDGGACFTEDADLARRMREIRVHGQDRRYHHPTLGFNGRMDTLQAAILLAKFDRYEAELSARAVVGARYTERFESSSDKLTTPYVEPHNTSVYAQYTVQVDARDVIVEKLKSARGPTAVHYPVPLHLQPVFESMNLGVGRGSFPVAERAADRVFSLPMHPFLEAAQQDEIIEATLAAISAT
ncbi:MAG: DegT/DnrJ/EryC1/StrS family aminotransferase [Gammaproteobacteria bacterium]|nr:DegT/DnrJ/EryC1/StrS family aminotransferase [Gammaproteobacteria bacterium]